MHRFADILPYSIYKKFTKNVFKANQKKILGGTFNWKADLIIGQFSMLKKNDQKVSDYLKFHHVLYY